MNVLQEDSKLSLQKCRISVPIKYGQGDINEFWGMLQAVEESYLYIEIADGRKWRRMRQTLISDTLWERRQQAQIEAQSLIESEQIPNRTKPFLDHLSGQTQVWLRGPHLQIYSKGNWAMSWATCGSWSCFNNRLGPDCLQRSLTISTILCFCSEETGGQRYLCCQSHS